MKKRLLTLSLVAGISVIALSACSDPKPLTKKDGVVLTLGNGEEYTTEDLFNQFKTTNSTGISAYYNAISEVLVRNAMREEAESQEVKSIVATRIANDKQKARDNASLNGTSYKEELKIILESANVETLAELEDKYVYEEIKSRLQDKYYDNHSGELLSDYIDTVFPYHVRHILLKVSSASGFESYSRGTITEQEARNLAALIRRLAVKTQTGANRPIAETFGTIAYDMSEDTESAKKYGDLGIMSSATGYVNEFKLGLYSYDTIFNPKTTGNEDKVHLSTSGAQSVVENHDIELIPYSETQELEKYADATTDKNNKLVNDGDAAYYPRNIYFNQYFNNHGLSLIINDTGITNNRFAVVKDADGHDLFGGAEVLHDEKGNVILVTRAGSGYEGVHFIIVEKSALSETKTVMTKYFDQTLPGQKNKDDETINVGETFVGFMKSTTNVYKERAEEVKSAIKGFDPMIDARLFEEYSKPEYNVTINPDLLTEINNYIRVSREYYAYETQTTLELAWQSYAGTLSFQEWASDNKVDLVCAGLFNAGYTDGDGCYEKK